jgi:hypothetical protein
LGLGYILADIFTNSSGHPANDVKANNNNATLLQAARLALVWQPTFNRYA